MRRSRRRTFRACGRIDEMIDELLVLYGYDPHETTNRGGGSAVINEALQIGAPILIAKVRAEREQGASRVGR